MVMIKEQFAILHYEDTTYITSPDGTKFQMALGGKQ